MKNVLMIGMMMVLTSCGGCSGKKSMTIEDDLRPKAQPAPEAPPVVVDEPANFLRVYENGESILSQESDTGPVQGITSPFSYLGRDLTIEVAGEVESLSLRNASVEISGEASIDRFELRNCNVTGDISEIDILDPSFLFEGSDLTGLTGISTIVRPHHLRLINNFIDVVYPLNFDVSTFNTSHVTEFRFFLSGMDLDRLSGINNIDLSSATKIDGFFAYSSGVVDVTGWDTSNVTSINTMFGDFSGSVVGLDSVDLSRVEDASGAFLRVNLDNITGINNLVLPSLTSIYYMFEGASGDIDVSGYNVSAVTSLDRVFQNYSGVISGLEEWDTSNVTRMEGTFVLAITDLYGIEGWDTSSVTNMDSMFASSNSSTTIDLSGWCVSNIPSLPSFFSTDSNLDPLNHPVWGTCP